MSARPSPAARGAGGPTGCEEERIHAVKLDHDTWVVVADGEKYLLLRNKGDPEFLHLEVIDHEQSENPPAREMATDRPGRQHDATRQTGGDVAAYGSSAMDDTDWHRLEEERFARNLAGRLSDMVQKGRFGSLVLIADPRSLGAIRAASDDRLRAVIVAEMDKDLTNLPLEGIERSIMAHDG